MLRSAKRCAADPGSSHVPCPTWIPALRSSVKNAAPRPGHVTRSTLLHTPPELVRLRQTMCEAAGVGAVAAPVGQFLPAQALLAPRRVLPHQAALGLESSNIRQRGAGVFLQAH